jgi:hypothetical protein
MSSQDHPPPPPVPPSPPNSGGVRRHHTISASSRTARASAKDAISEESQEQVSWNEDEVVDEDWVGGVGAVGEKTSLHRQSSLPTRYHRGKPCPLNLHTMPAAVMCHPITDHGCTSVMLALRIAFMVCCLMLVSFISPRSFKGWQSDPQDRQ